MAHAVFIQNPISIYKDRAGEVYHFPKRYLSVVQEAIDDWVVFYESRKGAFGYTGVQKVRKVVPDIETTNHYYAILDPATEWTFEQVVPRANPVGRAYEHSLRKPDGSPMSGGASVSAVRRLTEQEFGSIVQYGLAETVSPDTLPRKEETPSSNFQHERGFGDKIKFEPASLAPFRRSLLTSRKARDASFARQVKAAYGGCCAISGLMLRNGGGRPEVEAAHIRPVARNGPDTVRNGLALSGTLHWMFDRGLISVAEDHSILISHNKVPPEVVNRLVRPEQKLLSPQNPRHVPHPDYLRFHREHIFGQGSSSFD